MQGVIRTHLGNTDFFVWLKWQDGRKLYDRHINYIYSLPYVKWSLLNICLLWSELTQITDRSISSKEISRQVNSYKLLSSRKRNKSEIHNSVMNISNVPLGLYDTIAKGDIVFVVNDRCNQITRGVDCEECKISYAYRDSLIRQQ